MFKPNSGRPRNEIRGVVLETRWAYEFQMPDLPRSRAPRDCKAGPSRRHKSSTRSAESASTIAVIMPHRALVVDEILREVTTWLIQIHYPTIVSLACCAKFLEEPALSTLWDCQETLPTLIKTLPPDSWELHTGEAENIIVRGSPRLRWYFTLLN